MATEQWIERDGRRFYAIVEPENMTPFFMSLTNPGNQWCFIASTGGLSAGRIDSTHALFPYYPEDIITENFRNTGSLTLIRVMDGQGSYELWEPILGFSTADPEREYRLLKSEAGDILVFEETNHRYGLRFSYEIRQSPSFGFVKRSFIANMGEKPRSLELIDGLQNILPPLVNQDAQRTMSALLDAYKRHQLIPDSGLSVLALNAVLTDKAEPSEALLATTCWSYPRGEGELLSSLQVEAFRRGATLASETEVKGRRGAFFSHRTMTLSPGSENQWVTVVDLDMDHRQVWSLNSKLMGNPSQVVEELEGDLRGASERLDFIVASADGVQLSGDVNASAHHRANVMFNVMRGGYLPSGYSLPSFDLIRFVSAHNRDLGPRLEELLAGRDQVDIDEVDGLLNSLEPSYEKDRLVSLLGQYLPLAFSRRHGDPSRPWNAFSIVTEDENGNLILNYQGNWRDIFQNWEALLPSYPRFISHGVSVFFSATSADGYNPYRVTKTGFEWEAPEPDNPWSNIGYWSDHQLIYGLKLLELLGDYGGDELQELMEAPRFPYANIPYRIADFEAMVKDPYNTIDFDYDAHREISQRAQKQGNDGKLLVDGDGRVIHGTLVEKILSLLMAKVVNLVPDGGVWMNTQRPEWNDANNALVGKGLSVVTLGYLRRFVTFLLDFLGSSDDREFQVREPLIEALDRSTTILSQWNEAGDRNHGPEGRYEFMAAMGRLGSEFRHGVYNGSFVASVKKTLPLSSLKRWLEELRKVVDESLSKNERSDGLYHSYSTLAIEGQKAEIHHLYPMLEGQVSILSSGYLTPGQAAGVLEQLPKSPLYRADQHSYMLYPDRETKGFIDKNSLSIHEVKKALGSNIEEMIPRIFVRGEGDNLHFRDQFSNGRILEESLGDDLSHGVKTQVRRLYEEHFDHQSFTGRSGTFFAYEGLGSIYWHMVSKLLLACQEQLLAAHNSGDGESLQRLTAAYRSIRDGIGYKKSATVYGAFPTDPYSHSPKDQGARQPGMTGQVKEEILTRRLENGYFFANGSIAFTGILVDWSELLTSPSSFEYIDGTGNRQTIEVPAGSFAYTIAGVPVVCSRATSHPRATVVMDNGETLVRDCSGESVALGSDLSEMLLSRSGAISSITVEVT